MSVSIIGRQRLQLQQRLEAMRYTCLQGMATDISTDRERRSLGAAFALCAIASLTLLANHPGGGGASLAAVIKAEADHRLIDATVHGGFIITLLALMICSVFLSRWLGSTKAAVVIGLVAFCTGCGLLIASMILDGFVTPAIAMRLVGSEDLQPARTLLMLLGALIGVLMPMGMLLQSVAMLSWSAVIVRGTGLRRAVGAFGFVAALTFMAATFAIPAPMMTHVLLGGIVLQSVWYLSIAALCFNPAAWPAAARPGSDQQ